jgi:hypothetical protein
MATFEDMEKEQKEREKFLKSLKIDINEKKESITFRQKTLGKHKFTFKDRDVLFALLGMPMKDDEIEEIMDITEEEKERAYVTLIKGELLENIATVKKKKLRGDKHMQVFWRLTARGEKVARELVDYINELESKDKKQYQPLTKDQL